MITENSKFLKICNFVGLTFVFRSLHKFISLKSYQAQSNRRYVDTRTLLIANKLFVNFDKVYCVFTCILY